jgi:hypothetical protein
MGSISITGKGSQTLNTMFSKNFRVSPWHDLALHPCKTAAFGFSALLALLRFSTELTSLLFRQR